MLATTSISATSREPESYLQALRSPQAAEWKADLEKNYWADDFATGAKLRKELEQDYAETKAVLTDLGLAK